MLEETKTIDQIELKPETGHIQVRERIAIIKDGEELTFTFNRYVLEKYSDISNQPEQIQEIAKAFWGNNAD